eukprot:CAMPEP_0185573892 /NCGR_PEP_ID=MMETSP0434-20130131/5479_1 /TAXON_ID=626734 ORGANISM="Favella taraikaensis, Strain Fe Narragansett Bay" /NCGR_SAMPLE_ID=MMETSP0434 /ASSEMBLY_ACC=CAM_ASM_000379 /LENGTH=55 /DNA_ID=CAMNT_0028190267 /DNA_START=772 /DNA_END=942 /DNA_ORIENTATION=-
MHALNANERYRYCDLDFYRLLTPLMIADSKSYTLMHGAITQSARAEFLETQQGLI